MVSARKPTGRAMSVPAGLAVGALTGVAVTLIGSALLAYLINREQIPVTALGYGTMVILFLASAAGSALAAGKIKHLHLQVSLMTGGVFFLILLGINALFFGGQYRGIGVTAAAILAGSFIQLLTRMGKGRGVRRLYRKGGVR